MQGRIIKVSGPLIVADGMSDAKLFDIVSVGKDELIGEIIELREGRASIQVYEETSGLRVGDLVVASSMPLSVELAPGLVGHVFDGIGRPLDVIKRDFGDRIVRGINIEKIDHKKKWKFVPQKKAGDTVSVGDILGVVQESEIVENRILVRKGFEGRIKKIYSGNFTIDETIAEIETKTGDRAFAMFSRWPVRIGRPYSKKLSVIEPLVTGQRVIDTLFPIGKGGVAAIPGPFGSGKTVVQHQLAKWSEADIVVYIGCGERGNEITDVLDEFPKLRDPKTGDYLMQRVVLIANTSDMPVAAREASIYTGITIAEYYRDMGYNVVVMADSTSRWAEALREMSGRLEEMPGEEGYPAYLGSRIAQFYERAGSVMVLGSDGRRGSITAIGAVSPQGGDLSEPVTQATLRIVKVFWGLSSGLAYRRHYPAIDWLVSYSGYTSKLEGWYQSNLPEDFVELRKRMFTILQEEAELSEVVQLVGYDTLSNRDKLTLDCAQSLREDFLHQNAFAEVDTYTSLMKQYLMLRAILAFHTNAVNAIASGVNIDFVLALPVREEIARTKYIRETELEKFDELMKEIILQFSNLSKAKGG